MTTLRLSAPPPSPLLTRVPLSTEPLPALGEPPPHWPGRQISSGGLVMHVRETPSLAVDPVPSVYLHGLGGSATNWTDLAGLLAGRASGLAIDLPGFGLSQPLASADYSMSAQADAVAGILAGLDTGPVHLFGNSMGGGIALLLADRHPELVTTLTLISPAMPDLRLDLRRMSDPRLALAMLPVVGRLAKRGLVRMTPEEHTEQLLRLCFADPARVTPERFALAVEECSERMTMPWAGSALAPAVGAILREWLVPPDRSLWAVAGRITAPTLVIWGDRDRVISVRKAARTARMLSRGRLLVLPRTGHAAQMERPMSVARAVLGMWAAVDRGDW